MRIIAAIDILEGKCVRLTRGDFDTVTIYDRDPVEAACKLENHGFRYLHLVDLDGAKKGRMVNSRIIEKVIQKTSLIIDFSGGIRTTEDIRQVFESGATQVTCGTIAVLSPHLFLQWLEQFGAGKIILGADFRNRFILTRGWASPSDIELKCFLQKYRDDGVVYAMCTDVDRDGMLTGPATDIYGELCGITGLKIIASGGITCTNDLHSLRVTGCEGAIIGKALYEGRIKPEEIKELC